MALMLETTERHTGANCAEPPPPGAPVFERFGESKIWAQQREYFMERGIEAWRQGEVPHYITSTAGTAAIYADIIVDYWQAALAAGDIDPDKPLYVLELGAGCGRLTYLLHKALRERLAEAPHPRVCYLASDIAESNLDFIATHPYLRDAIEAGELDTVLWDAEAGGELHLRAHRYRVARTENPLVVVANYVFDSLRHDLFGIHYGAMFEGRIAIRGNGSGNGGGHYAEGGFEYQWLPIESADWIAPQWRQHVQRYAARLNSASVLFPSGALRCMEHVDRMSRGRYLLLSADKGAYTEQQLRAGAGVDIALHGSFSLPVNYHALAACLYSQGAQVWNTRHRDDGLVYHAALRSGNPAAYDDAFAQIVERLEAVNPDDYFTLKKTTEVVARQLAPEQMLALLRLGKYDYRILGLMIEPALAQCDALSADSRRLWRDALERCWGNYFPLGESDGFHYDFGLLAARLAHWGLARDAFRLGLAVYGEDTETLYQLAVCEASTGGVQDALAAVERALELVPGHRSCAQLRERLAARQRDREGGFGIATDEELMLEPLGIEHAAALLEQYRDPQIGVMTRLPELATLEEAVAWIVEQKRDEGRVTFAVMHRCWGFIGTVSLHCHEDAGYFYFWIGADHQGNGYGRRAATMLFRLAQGHGIREIFTSAYGDNRRSCDSLMALGFHQLAAAADAPDNDLVFFRRPLRDDEAGGQEDAVARLQRLCRAIDSPIKLRGMQDDRTAGGCRQEKKDRPVVAGPEP